MVNYKIKDGEIVSVRLKLDGVIRNAKVVGDYFHMDCGLVVAHKSICEVIAPALTGKGFVIVRNIQNYQRLNRWANDDIDDKCMHNSHNGYMYSTAVNGKYKTTTALLAGFTLVESVDEFFKMIGYDEPKHIAMYNGIPVYHTTEAWYISKLDLKIVKCKTLKEHIITNYWRKETDNRTAVFIDKGKLNKRMVDLISEASKKEKYSYDDLLTIFVKRNGALVSSIDELLAEHLKLKHFVKFL